MAANNSFKPTPLRSSQTVAGKACHCLASTTRRGLTQVLDCQEAMIPASCELPDIASNCPPLTPNVMLRLGFLGTGLGDKSALVLRTAVRLSDKAVIEYRRARAAVLAQIAETQRSAEEMMATGRIIYMFDFVDHMENCINAVRRLFALLNTVKDDPAIADNSPIKLAIEHALSKDVSDFRNTIEHMEERIAFGQLKDGQPVVLRLSDDSKSIEIGKYNIGLGSLATLLISLHAAVESLANVPASKAAI